MVFDDIWFVPLISYIYIKERADSLPVTMFAFGVVVIEVWETDLPVWGFVLSLFICASRLDLRHYALSSRVSHLMCSSIRVYSHFECDHGYYGPIFWAERHLGADHRIRPSWPPDCGVVVQDVGCFYLVTGDFVHERL